MPRHLLVVDDDPAVRRSLDRALADSGLKVSTAANAAEGLAVFGAASPDLVVLDLFLPDANGLDVLKTMREKDPDAAILVVTASEDVRDAVEAMKLGAAEYVTKPYNLEALKLVIQHALDSRRARLELGSHRRTLSERYTFDAMVAASPACAAVVSLARKLAQSPTATLLIEGETGTGKEFLARSIHHASPRAGGPFVAVSCAAIPETLLESELFGHEAGAFTDARHRKPGLFEMADGGTLFLDEIGEMATPMQAKLLRAIETHAFRRVGGTEDLTVDARIIAATNVGVERAVGEKRFREDLFYRLQVGHLRLPPLRDRTEDLVPLAGRLLLEIGREVSRPGLVLSAEAERRIRGYRWPGNVRELRNVLERAVLLHEGGSGPVEPRHLPADFGGEAGAPGGPAAVPLVPLAAVEREHILKVVAACGGNRTRAAKVLGVSHVTLREKLKLYGAPHDPRSGGAGRS